MKLAELPQDLYPRLLGGLWEQLPDAVRAAHVPAVTRQGRFRVLHGNHRLLRPFMAWTGLPPEAAETEVILTIHSDGGHERWERHFGKHGFTTKQWDRSGCLYERWGVWELRFRLKVIRGSLIYEPCGTRLCLGSLRLPVPAALAPQVRASESALDSDGRLVHVSVDVTVPCMGRLVCYEGHLQVVDPNS